MILLFTLPTPTPYHPPYPVVRHTVSHVIHEKTWVSWYLHEVKTDLTQLCGPANKRMRTAKRELSE